jgi:hypothetical protein
MSDQAIVANRSVDRISSSSSSSPPPPGPGVVDGLPLRVRLPAVAQTLWLVFGMDSFVRYVYDRYPEEGMLTARVLGFGDVVTVLDPDLIREVLTGDGEVLRAGEANAQALGFLGPNSVVLLDGEPHLRTRRLCCLRFTERRSRITSGWSSRSRQRRSSAGLWVNRLRCGREYVRLGWR